MQKIFSFDFKTIFGLFILFIICLLLEGVYYFYYEQFMQIFGILDYEARTGYSPLIWNENGIVEYIQIFFLICSIIFIYYFSKYNYSKLNSLEKFLIFLYLLGLLYYFLEEISWGQHIIGWESSDFFVKINHQGETNLHNISSIFNELPRNLLLIWCSLTFLIIKKIPLQSEFLFNFIFPHKNLKYISILILFFFIPDFLVDNLNFLFEEKSYNEKNINLKAIFHLITFNFIRLSELEELLFNFYILSHSFYLVKVKLYNNKLT